MRRTPVRISSENTSTSTSSDVLHAAVTQDLRMIRSPTLIGCRNCRPSTAAVTRRLRVCRWHAMAPAMSMRCMTVPPRMNPRGFASFGSTTCTISVNVSEGRFAVIQKSIAAVAIEECLQRAPQFGREVFVPDRVEERDGGLVGLQLRHAAGAGRQVALERLVHPRRQLMLDEVGQQ